MAIGIQNFPNIDTSDPTNYPDGKIKDNPGDNTGTPFNALVYGDIHQFFAKALRDTGITPNGAAEVNGNAQYVTAIVGLCGGVGELIEFDRTSSLADVSNAKSPLILVTGGGGGATGDLALEDSTSATERHLGVVTIKNNGSSTVTVFPDSGSSDTIDGASSLFVPNGTSVRLVLDKTGNNWISL